MTTTNSATTNKNYDLLIIGGGLSGVLSALSLADVENQQGEKLSIAIVDAHPLATKPELTYDDRVLALAHGTVSYLQQLDAWHELSAQATAITDIHVSDRGHYGKARLTARDHQVSALGYVVELSLLGQALLTKAQTKANIDWFCPAKVAEINWQQQQVNVTLDDNTQLQAKLLLGCDGTHSECRTRAGISANYQEYGQSAIIANVSTQKPHNGKAFERFTEFGPIAMLPLSNNRCSLVWTQPPEQAEAITKLSDADFTTQLQQAFGDYLGKITKVGKRSVYPLILMQAERNSYHRMALIGNASHAIHPIAGQGFNLGLRDVKKIAELVAQTWQQSDAEPQADIGALSLLQQYENDRKQDQSRIINVTDSLVHIFSNQYWPLVLGRNIGLKAMNYLSPLKHRLAKVMMGYN